jgi:hypothetical protein
LLRGIEHGLEFAFATDSRVLRYIVVVVVLGVFSHFCSSVVGTVFHLLFLIEKLIDIDTLPNYCFEDLELVLKTDFLVFNLLLYQDELF